MRALWSSPSYYFIALLPSAALLDYFVGDPWSWPHPVQVMGQVITLYTRRVLNRNYSPTTLRCLGILLAFLLIGGTGTMTAAALWILAKQSVMLRWCVELVLLASCFAGRSLRDSAEDVFEPLLEKDLPEARERLSKYVGRDTQSLSALEIRRAVLETVSENAIDGVLAPLFYAIVGALVGWAAPMALAYKAASTLDSMVGYKEAPYTHIGWFSARFEDGLTWLPCRLSVLMIAILSGHPKRVLSLCNRDASADPSPNAGWSECAYASALGVQLGGRNTYRGKIKDKPLLGDDLHPIVQETVWQALRLTRWSFIIGLIVGMALLLAVV